MRDPKVRLGQRAVEVATERGVEYFHAPLLPLSRQEHVGGVVKQIPPEARRARISQRDGAIFIHGNAVSQAGSPKIAIPAQTSINAPQTRPIVISVVKQHERHRFHS